MAAQTISAQEFLRRAHTRLDQFTAVAQGLERLQEEHRAKIAGLERARTTALEELTATLLPTLSPTCLASVQEATGYGQFAVDDPLERMHLRQQQLAADVHAIATHATYIQRDALIGDVTGSLILQRDAIDEDIATLRPGLEQYECAPRLIALIQAGYDTAAYQMPWWRLQYYRDWKWGDIYTAQFQHQRFRDLREAYLRLLESHSLREQDRARVQAEIQHVLDLIAQRQHALDALASLATDTLAQCRQQLQEHLTFIDREELAQRAVTNPVRAALLKRLHGIEKKMAYLDEMTRHHTDLELGLLHTTREKLQRRITRFQRPKYARTRISLADAESWCRDPMPRVTGWRERYTRQYTTIYHFESYDTYSYGRAVLWWDLMTDGRIDGDFIPEVHAWRAGHPEAPGAIERDILHAGGAFIPTEAHHDDLQEVS